MPDLPLWLWVVGSATALLASTITTITSIGAGLIVYGILGLFVDLKILIPIFAPAQLLAVAVRTWLFRRYIHWRYAAYFLVGVVPGIYGGALIFQILSELALRRMLGIFLLGFALYEWFRNEKVSDAPPAALLPIGGLGAGILLGSMGVPGPFLAVVFLRYGLLKESLIAMISLFFLLGNAQRTLLYWQQGLLTAGKLQIGITMGLAMILGVYLGRLILPHVSRALFVRLILGLLVLFGVKFLIW